MVSGGKRCCGQGARQACTAYLPNYFFLLRREARRSKGLKLLRLGTELRGEVVKYAEDTARRGTSIPGSALLTSSHRKRPLYAPPLCPPCEDGSPRHCRYKLVGLLPSASYEVKLSYPGISHARVSLRWGGGKHGTLGGGGRRAEGKAEPRPAPQPNSLSTKMLAPSPRAAKASSAEACV